jgi:hypothetical protein
MVSRQQFAVKQFFFNVGKEDEDGHHCYEQEGFDKVLMFCL